MPRLTMRPVRLNRSELKEKLYRRRYLVPNAVTVGNMFCGFLTCIYAAAGHFDKAVLAIGIALLLDGLDGRVARRLNATSKFGIEFDSFSDLISFGIAPAILIYHWSLIKCADEFGVLVAFVYAICAASRLARFNISQENLKSFMGLPTPGAAGMVAALVNCSPEQQTGWPVAIVGSCLLVLLGFLMVSKIEFFSVKLIKVSRLGFFSRIVIGSLIALIWYNNRIGFFVLASAYCLSGPVKSLMAKKTAPIQNEDSTSGVGISSEQVKIEASSTTEH